MSPRCLSTLEPLDREGYSASAQASLAGAPRPFPHRLEYRRAELILRLLEVVERMSVSGVQQKVGLELVGDRLELTDVGGQFILKLVGADLPLFEEDVAANEHVTMLVASRVFGLETPPCGLVRLADDELAFLVKRFDAPRGEKVPQEDFSQLMDRSEASHGAYFKYDSSYEEVGEVLRRINPDPAQTERLYVQLLCSYALSNGDAHLKNFSMYRPDPAGPYVLTPAYDLLCTSLHIPNEARLALELFKDAFVTPAFEGYGFETYACFAELAARLGIASERAQELLRPFVTPQPVLEDLVGRSFLSPAAKADYLLRYRDRLKALRIGAP